MRILMIEDDKELAEITKLRLEKRQFHSGCVPGRRGGALLYAGKHV